MPKRYIGDAVVTITIGRDGPTHARHDVYRGTVRVPGHTFSSQFEPKRYRNLGSASEIDNAAQAIVDHGSSYRAIFATPSKETARAIEAAVRGARKSNGDYVVRRSAERR